MDPVLNKSQAVPLQDPTSLSSDSDQAPPASPGSSTTLPPTETEETPATENQASEDFTQAESAFKKSATDFASNISAPPSPPSPPLGPSPDEKTESSPTEEGLKPATPPPPPALDTKSKVLLTVGPLFLIASLGISAFISNTRSAQPTQFPAEPAKPTAEVSLKEASNFDAERLRYILENSPQNPTQVTVTCQSTGETLTSDTPTTCPDPVFTWSGETSKEPGTKIIAYYVYFGTKGDDRPISLDSKLHDVRKVIQPFRDGVHQTENTFKPQNLTQGTTYYFAVSAESDTQNGDIRLGLDPVSIDPPVARSAKILFTYIYE